MFASAVTARPAGAVAGPRSRQRTVRVCAVAETTRSAQGRKQAASPKGTPEPYPMDQSSRPRRNRRSEAIRRGIRETFLGPEHFILPIFVHEEEKNVPIPSMPGIERLSFKNSVKDYVARARSLGVNQVVIFPKTPDHLKSPIGEEAFNPDGLSQRTIRLLKDSFPDLEVYTDVALDPYSTDGHDGIVRDDGVILNDQTIELLCRQAVSQAEAGADCVAPSDMMDSRVAAIRESLDMNGFTDVSIMSYTAKYASAYYGPFRDALDSAPRAGETGRVIPPNKRTYQMDPANLREALRLVFSRRRGSGHKLTPTTLAQGRRSWTRWRVRTS